LQDISRILLGELGELVSSVAVLVVGFILLALPAVRVILRERDEYLERGIRAACRLAASKSESDQGRVVAVLGLLHVNGVAKRLVDKGEK
jgi:pheromone shutdown protein TraB